MAQEGTKELTLKLNQLQTAAMYHCLSGAQVKGRSDRRLHSRLMKALKTGAMKMTDEINGEFVGGVVVATEDALTYFQETVNEVVTKGFPGQLAEGYETLEEQLNALLPKPEKKDDKK